MVSHRNGGLLCVAQESHIVLDAKCPSLGSAELIFLHNCVLDENVDCPWEVVFEVLDLQIVGDNLFIALMVHDGPFKDSVMESFGT